MLSYHMDFAFHFRQHVGQSIGFENIIHRGAFADLDGDDNLYLFMAHDASYVDPSYYEGCPNEVWFNDGKGTFTNSGQLLGHEPSSRVQLADFDNDGDLDAWDNDTFWFNDGIRNIYQKHKNCRKWTYYCIWRFR